jgi:hypothetical protein
MRPRLCGVRSRRPLLYDDGFAVLDRESPDVDSKLGDNDSD